MLNSTVKRWLVACMLAIAPLSAPLAQEKPITLIVGASPGGTTDRVARGIAQEMGKILGQTVIVDNKPGAGGNIAADLVARSPKDGNTLLVSFTSFTVNASLYKKLPFDPEKDFTPISMLAQVPSVLVVRKDLPANSVADLIELAKQRPDSISFGLGGIGSSLHMATANFHMMTGIKALTVPYKGTAPALQDLLGGQIDAMFASVENVVGMVGSDRIKFLGVSSPEPLPAFKGVPPIANTVPGFTSQAWFGIFGPAGLAPERLEALSKAVRQGAASQSFIDLMTPAGSSVVTNTPEEFRQFISQDIAHYAKVVEFTGATAE